MSLFARQNFDRAAIDALQVFMSELSLEDCIIVINYDCICQRIMSKKRRFLSKVGNSVNN